MSAGLPGLGLGGLFFVISALLAPLFELQRMARGQSSAAAWRQVGRQFAIAVSMIVAVDLALRALLFTAGLLGAETDAGGAGLTVLPLAPIGITTALLAAVVVGAKALQLVLRVSGGRRKVAGGAPRPLCPRPCTCCAQAARG